MANVINTIVSQNALAPIEAAEALPAAAGLQFTQGQIVALNSGGFLVPFLASNSASAVLSAGLLVSPSTSTVLDPTGATASDGDYILSFRAGTFDMGNCANNTPSGATGCVQANIASPVYSIDGLNVSSHKFTNSIFVGYMKALNSDGTVAVEVRDVLSAQLVNGTVGATGATGPTGPTGPTGA